MDFSSVQFIFVFLLLTILVYYLMPRVCRNVVLGAAFINWLGGLLLG